MPARAVPLRPSIARLSPATVTRLDLDFDLGFDLDFVLALDFAMSPPGDDKIAQNFPYFRYASCGSMPDRIAVRIWLSVPTATAAAETISAARPRGSTMMPSRSDRTESCGAVAEIGRG